MQVHVGVGVCVQGCLAQRDFVLWPTRGIVGALCLWPCARPDTARKGGIRPLLRETPEPQPQISSPFHKISVFQRTIFLMWGDGVGGGGAVR